MDRPLNNAVLIAPFVSHHIDLHVLYSVNASVNYNIAPTFFRSYSKDKIHHKHV